MDQDVRRIADQIQDLLNVVSRERYDDGWNDALNTLLGDDCFDSVKEIIKSYLTT